ncbi:MAG: class I SAM-dependent methyltransferase, partial [Candidatus Dormibacteraeota bacterium]|nr:class I SAM-dependent methyltransferase [Candidatus Dormibacteraeota bacterium]
TQAAIAAAYSAPDAYDHWLREESGRAQMWTKRVAMIEALQPARGRLLDVGAGIGTFLALARDRGWQVAGSEVSDSAVRLAADRHGLTLVQGQLETAELGLGSFDVVTLWHVLEHVPSPFRTLRTCRRLLRPGGLVVIAVPNDSPAMIIPRRLKRLLTRTEFRRYEPVSPGQEVHLSHFTPAVLRTLLVRTGFTAAPVTVDDQYPMPDRLTDLRVTGTRMLTRATGINLGNSLLVSGRS